jgi:predicted nucleotidyltransferase
MIEPTDRQPLPESGDDAILAKIVQRLIDAYRPETIYLFGSRARGDAGADSDYDLLVVVPDDAVGERSGSRLAYEVLWGTGTAADVLVWPHSRFERKRHVIASLPATIVREGRAIYER